MSRLTRIAALVAVFVFAFGIMSANAAKKKTPAKKPAATSNHATQGTTQLKGEYGDFGATYTLGKTDPFNITLKSAEYTVEPVRIGENTFVPTVDEKLLVLRMTYHNPQSQERFVRWDNFGFTVVDPQSQNHDNLAELGMEKDKQPCAMTFKPAQKVDVYGVMVVPATGEMPKLIIKSVDELVLRYDLRGKVKGLSEPFADSADKTRATPLAKVPAVLGTYYPLGLLSVKLDKVEFSSNSKFGESECGEGERFLVAQMAIKNICGTEQFMRWDGFDSKVIDTDGVEVSGCVDMLQKSKDKSFATEVQPGQEITVRCLFKIPDETALQTFSTRLGEGRTFVFDISSVK
ncbi:MAG: hypothetical protein ACYC64_15690 [Armatimonadota bacterium]